VHLNTVTTGLIWVLAATGCGGSSIEGASVHTGPAPWVIGGVQGARVDAAAPSSIEDSGASVTPLNADVVGPDDVTQGELLDAVPPPDGFPVRVESDCPEGSLCGMETPETCFEGRCNSLGDCIVAPIAGCCEEDAECAAMIPQTACDTFRCIQSSCVAMTRPGCCSGTVDCEDATACTTDVCRSGPGGQCTHCPVDCECPDAEALHAAYFDGPSLPSEGFGINDQQADSVSWRLSSRRAISAPTSAWLGHSVCPTYFSGTLGFDCQPSTESGIDSGPVRAELVGPAIALPESPGGYIASFWLWSDVEVLGAGGADERDVLTVMVHDLLADISWPVTSSLAVGKSTGGGWQQLALDLSPWRGSTISLRFSFDTLDGYDNHHEGVYLDDLRIQPRCLSGCCDVDADCPAGAGSDACLARRCVTLADGAGGTCLEVPSLPGATCVACASDAACADEDPCTDDLCGLDGVCEHASFCCLEVSAYASGFEGGLASWYVSDDQPLDSVGWTTSEESATEGVWAAWLGDPMTGTYATGGPVRGTLQTTHIQLPEAQLGEVAVRFALNLSTEWDGFPYDNPSGIDRLSLEVVASGQELVEIWSSDAVSGSTGGVWTEVVVSLQAWTGQSVQLRFVFDSGDGDLNDYSGPRIDDLRVGQVCP
jgi:hypothetical protein